MTFDIFGISRPARGFFIVLFVLTGFASVAKPGLSEADRITLTRPPACR
jgi:hypothetical protein